MFLSLDTSTLTLSLALVEGAAPDIRAVEEVTIGPPRKQSELLPGEIGALLGRHGVKLEALEGIAIGLGPGSFTGLRIGLASVKALAYAANLKVAGVPSLRAAALAGPEGVPLFAAAVARQGELYAVQLVRRGASLEVVAPEDALTPAELARRVVEQEAARVIGPVVATSREELERCGVPADRLLDTSPWPRAVDVARLAVFPPAPDLQALFALEPLYVRASEAERNPKFPPLPGPAPTARLKED